MSEWLVAEPQPNGDLKVMWTDEQSSPKRGRDVLIKVRRPRNPRHHRKYWGMIRAITEATGLWHTQDECHRWVKRQVGHYVTVGIAEGIDVIELLPTDCGSMNQAEFNDFYRNAVAELAMETGIDPVSILDVDGE